MKPIIDSLLLQKSFLDSNALAYKAKVDLPFFLTLLDIKICSNYCEEGRNLLLEFLKYHECFQDTKELKPFERIHLVSEVMLEKILLWEVKTPNMCFYALAEESDLLNHRVYEIRHCGNIQPLLLRVQTILEKHSELVKAFEISEPFYLPWGWQTLNLSIGKYLTLQPQEINKAAPYLPANSCALLSSSQFIQSIDFNLFSGEQLEFLMNGDKDPDGIKDRFGLLKPSQLIVFVNKTSGASFKYLPDSFYEQLILPHLNSDKRELIFKYPSCTEEGTKRRLHLLGFLNLPLLPETLLKMLSDVQYKNLDVTFLKKETVQKLFPGFTYERLFPNHKHTINMNNSQGKLEHTFESQFKSSQEIQDELLSQQIEEKKLQCKLQASKFNFEQIVRMAPLMFPEVRELLLK